MRACGARTATDAGRMAAARFAVVVGVVDIFLPLAACPYHRVRAQAMGFQEFCQLRLACRWRRWRCRSASAFPA